MSFNVHRTTTLVRKTNCIAGRYTAYYWPLIERWRCRPCRETKARTTKTRIRLHRIVRSQRRTNGLSASVDQHNRTGESVVVRDGRLVLYSWARWQNSCFASLAAVSRPGRTHVLASGRDAGWARNPRRMKGPRGERAREGAPTGEEWLSAAHKRDFRERGKEHAPPPPPPPRCFIHVAYAARDLWTFCNGGGDDDDPRINTYWT